MHRRIKMAGCSVSGCCLLRFPASRDLRGTTALDMLVFAAMRKRTGIVQQMCYCKVRFQNIKILSVIHP
uniref:Uncharacterized protein n=1 Tax=Arion vulgaris TaxID=1028688 RepID=A0A0B7AE94_9EUPU